MRKGRIEIDRELCKGCEFCIEFCPRKIIKFGEELNLTGFCFAVCDDPENKCNACKICAIVCPEAAIEVFKETDCQNDCGGNCDCKKGGDND